MEKCNAPIRMLFFLVVTLCLQSTHSQQGQEADKSTISITYPMSSTVWEIPELAELRWTTKNMDTTKSIRFFLVRNKTVVQELGRFKNNGHATGIRLAKNINSGGSYQVMGMELFPNKKDQVAKFVTPFFTIKNKESDERKRLSELARNDKVPSKRQDKLATLSADANTKARPIPKEFEGRRISYVKNLAFESEHLKVKIWDHEKEDGDIVSIYLNGELVLSKHLLTNDLREFDIELDPAKPNDLLLYAHNLGEVSPNTVSVEIASASKAETITLNSYLRSCEAVLISVKK
ncbi:hypothetical protein [Flagellimonas meishanensis]|uniref:hypothetical protein n=1 Tax=Flagellimonas meishanensis TaxID=2873264 RepID=UPI001CA6A964|nr:hypothetical protein [[Muricauda] meishanensis]